MRTVLVQQTDFAIAVTKADEIFAQKPHPHRWAIRQRNFLRQQRRNRVTPHQISHRCAGTDASQSLFSARENMVHSPLTDGFKSDVLTLDEASVVGQAETRQAPCLPGQPW